MNFLQRIWQLFNIALFVLADNTYDDNGSIVERRLSGPVGVEAQGVIQTIKRTLFLCSTWKPGSSD